MARRPSAGSDLLKVEKGAEPGDGFANVDNLAFDSQGNVWGVTDMSTEAHNGFATGVAATPTI